MTISLGLSSPPRGSISLAPPPETRPLWPGFVLAAAFLVSEFFELPLQTQNGVSVIQYAFVFGSWFYYLACVYRLHEIVGVLAPALSSPPLPYEIEPSSAVVRHFIPFYNFFWIVRWPMPLSEFVNRQLREGRMIPGLVLGLLLLFGGVFGRMVDGALSVAILFSVLAHISKKVRKLVAEAMKTFGAASVFE